MSDHLPLDAEVLRDVWAGPALRVSDPVLDWFRTNGIDPNRVPLYDAAILYRHAGTLHLAVREVVLDDNGRAVYDQFGHLLTPWRTVTVDTLPPYPTTEDA